MSLILTKGIHSIQVIDVPGAATSRGSSGTRRKNQLQQVQRRGETMRTACRF